MLRQIRGLHVLAILAAFAGCDSFLGPDTRAFYQLTESSGHLTPLTAASVRLTTDDKIEVRRTYEGSSDTRTSIGDYHFKGDSLRVAWVTDSWYTYGRVSGDTLTLAYSGIVDEGLVEIYVRR